MASLADKLRQAAALMKKGGEEKKEINSSLGLPPSAPITATKTTAQTTVTDLNEHKEVVKDISVSLGIADPNNYTPPKFSTIRAVTTQTVNDLNNYKQSSTNFYQCAYLPTEDKKWMGKKAVQAVDGSWSLEDNVTALSCDKGYTPEIGKFYNSDATVKVESLYGLVSIPTDYKLYIPFNRISTIAETGQGIEVCSGTLLAVTKSGLPMTCFDTNTWARTRLDPSRGDNDVMPNTSWSFWYCREQANGGTCELMTSDGSGYAGRLYIRQDNIDFNGATIYYPFENNTVYHICIVASDFSQPETGAVSYYINGQFVGSAQTAGGWNSPTRNVLEIHVERTPDGAVNTTSYFAGLRFYDRCITEDEVIALSKEYTPTT